MTKKSNITFFSLFLEWNSCWREWDLSLTHSAATPDGSTLAQSCYSSHLFLHGASERGYPYLWWVGHHPEAVVLLSSLFERNPGISTGRAALGNGDSLFYGAFGGQATAMEAKCWCAQKPFAENPSKPLLRQSLLGESNYSNHLPTYMRKIHRSDKFPTWKVDCDKEKEG